MTRLQLKFFSAIIVAISWGSMVLLPLLDRIRYSPLDVQCICREKGISSTRSSVPSTFNLCGTRVILGCVLSWTWRIKSNTFSFVYMKSWLISFVLSAIPIKRKPPFCFNQVIKWPVYNQATTIFSSFFLDFIWMLFDFLLSLGRRIKSTERYSGSSPKLLKKCSCTSFFIEILLSLSYNDLILYLFDLIL